MSMNVSVRTSKVAEVTDEGTDDELEPPPQAAVAAAVTTRVLSRPGLRLRLRLTAGG
jgi:hypothetical protein